MPVLPRIHQLADFADFLQEMEDWMEADRLSDHAYDRPACTCYTHGVIEECPDLLCKLEGMLADARCLVVQWVNQQRKAPCGCPDRGFGWVEHRAECRAEIAAERAELRRPA